MATTGTPGDVILDVQHLSMKFGGLVAIGDLSLQARRGEITALIGPNGAGKTTVFNCITGFYKPTEGMIRLNRRDGTSFLLERLPNHEIPARAKVARTFQNIRLFSGMTLLENLLVAQHNKLMKASGYTVLGLLGIGNYRQASAESIELAKFWLEKTELVDRADDPAGDLPYGAQRRLEIARAMCTGPELLCLDEPAAGLNPKESASLNNLLIDIKESTGTSILLIEHDMSVVMQISDHVVVLEYGRKISDGSPEKVRNDPRVIAAYLGVDDEEVGEVLAEVGDEQVIEQLEGTADPAHGAGASASMMAGAVADTVGHSDDHGERVTVSPGASKAERVDAIDARKAKAPPAARPKPGSKAEVVKVATVSAAPAGKASAPATRSRPAKAAAPTAAPATKTSNAKTASAKPVPAKAAPAKPTTAKAAAKPVAASTPAKAAPAKPAPAKAAAPKAAPAPKPANTKAAPSKPAPAKAAPAKPATAKAAAKTVPAPAAAPPDDLTRIKGIGPVNQRKLAAHGITRFDQIAGWKKADIVAVEAYLAFDGRIAREDWIGQAKALAKASAKAAKAQSKPVETKRGGAK